MNLTSAVSFIQSLSCIIAFGKVIFPVFCPFLAGGIACLNFNTLTSLLDKLSISSVFAELGKAVKILPEMKHLPTNRVRSSRHSNLSCTQP